MKASVQRLVEYMRRSLQHDMTNNYTALSPKRRADGSYVMTVKDGTETGTLEVTVRELPVIGEK